uniref:Putative heat shock factor hsf-type dna-binding domain-containing protein n=1 Tax=Corethrella appendiculata TaxID=1370023 RepID=U5EQ25_9DIPT
MCLPFELRFLGTCLEELGRRDAQELRGIELRVNNPQEFVADIASCQSGEPADLKVRRKMALYLALIRACNHTCVNELFRTLDGWGDRDFVKFSDGDPLQELLLVYTMATNHPVFSFDQRMKCGEIFTKIKNSKLNQSCGGGGLLQQQQQSEQIHHQQLIANSPLHQHHPHSHPQQPQHLHQPHTQQSQSPILQNSTPPPPQTPQSIHALPPTQIPIQMIPQLGFAQTPLGQIIPGDPSIPTHVTVDGIPQMQIPIPQDFTMPPPQHWGLRNQPVVFNQPVVIDASFPPPATSPLLSQPASPIQSRTASPTRIPTSSVQHRLTRNANNNLNNNNNNNNNNNSNSNNNNNNNNNNSTSSNTASITTTSNSGGGGNINNNNNNNISVMTSNIVNSNEIIGGQLQQQNQSSNVKNMDEVLLNVDGALTQLQQLRNGYTRQTAHNTLPRQSSNKQSYLQHHLQYQQQQQQQQQQQHQQNYSTTGLSYALNNMNLIDLTKSGGSDSGSSGSTGEISPPDTPGLINTSSGNNNNNNNISSSSSSGNATNSGLMRSRSTNLGRINGRPDKNINTVIYTPPPQQQQQQYAASTGGNNDVMVISNSNNSNSNNSTISGSNNSNLTGSLSSGTIVNSVILNTQPQFTYPAAYHTTLPPPTPPTHLAGTAGRPIISHATTTAFRHPSAYVIQQPNGDILYPYPHQVAGTATFLPPVVPTQTAQTTVPTMRSSPSQQQIQTVNQIGLLQQQPQLPQPQQQKTALLTYPTTSYVTSCFNCGSQTHTGRECQEASMEDVTKSIYKLDYSLVTTNQQQLSSASSIVTTLAVSTSSPSPSTSVSTSSAASAASSRTNLIISNNNSSSNDVLTSVSTQTIINQSDSSK